MENKKKICDMLLPVLQETRSLHDLIDLEYDDTSETVLATFATGVVKRVNVAMDSGTSMIRDIIKQIV